MENIVRFVQNLLFESISMRNVNHRFLTDSLLTQASLPLKYCRFLRLSVCVSVCVCGNIWAFPHANSSPVQARIKQLGPKYAKHFASGPFCFGGWLNLIFQVKFKFISKSCLFASLSSLKFLWDLQIRMKTELVPHLIWLRTYIFANRVVPWTVKQSSCMVRMTIAGFQAVNSAISNGFWALL